jgi:hypothetical protein
MNMSVVAETSANLAHKTTALASEATLQVAIAAAIAAGGNIQAAFNVATKAHYSRLAASCVANGLDPSPFVQAGNWVGTHA